MWKVKMNYFPEKVTNKSKACRHSQYKLWKPFLLYYLLPLNLQS